MTPRQIVALALRLFAIWLGIRVLGYVPGLFGVQGSHPLAVYMTFMLALNTAIIVALWFFPGTIAWKLLPSDDAQSQPSATADTWLAMGCTLIGLWTLTAAIPRLVYDLFALNSMPGPDDEQHWVVLYDVVQLAIAAWLVLGGRGVGKLFQWARNAGIRKDP